MEQVSVEEMVTKGTPVETKVEETVQEKVQETVQEPVKKVEPKVNLDDYIPKSKALSWKREAKENAKLLAEYEAKMQETEEKDRMAHIRTMAIDKGLDDDTAEVLTSIAGELFKSVPKKDRVSEEIISEIEDYEYEYPDIKSQKKEIAETMKLYRKANPDFSVEDAYRLLKPTKSPREQRTELEQITAIESENAEPVPQGSGVKVAHSQLSDDDRRVLKLLQQAHPDKGWTEEKFLKNTKR